MNIKPLKEELSEEERAARSQKLVDNYFKKVGDARTKEQREEDLKKKQCTIHPKKRLSG